MYSSFYSPTGRAAWMYSAYEMAHASVQPFRAWASSVDRSMRDPRSPISGLPGAPFFRAGWRVFDELTRRYGKPEFGIESIGTDGINHHVEVEIVRRRTFCNLLRFTKTPQAATAQPPTHTCLQPLVCPRVKEKLLGILEVHTYGFQNV